jgi:alginate O-acetyltransferase complex protein AlgI
MLFNSYEFIFLFLPITVMGFWLMLRFLGRSSAVSWLLLASIAFYAYANLKSLAIIAPSILLDYGIAKLLLRLDARSERLRKALLIFGIAANVLFLGYFKYKNFFLDTANALFATHFALTQFLLPLGISFLVFQKIAFLADVYSGEVKAVGFVDFLLFTLFFPRTIAGPIIHYQEVLPQIAAVTPGRFRTDLAVGICLFSIGLFKKAVIADSVGQFVPDVFDRSSDTAFTGSPGLLLSWVAVAAYTFQLYFDFSGYSDMALGAARMLGVRLPMNFNSPFKAHNIVEFWGRWHITLTRFLTAYVYTPIVLHLTRSRISNGKSVLRGKRSRLSAIAALVAFPTLVTMALSGLWHGAGWQFVAWGLLHGIYLTINQSWRLIRPRLWFDQARYERVMNPVGRVLTFTSVMLALVLFRSDSITSARSVFENMLGLNGMLPHYLGLLEKAGVTIPWPMWPILLPSAAFFWIAALLFTVMYLPNSLELLRRFQPAFEFPGEAEGAALAARSEQSVIVSPPCGTPHASVTTKFRKKWADIRRIQLSGLDLSPFDATIIALMCALGSMALNQGSGFLYGGF